jgi:hypothetical protein
VKREALKPEVSSMPIGYIVGKQYRINTEYDQWAKLDIFSKILRINGQRGLSVFIEYSHIGRNYSAEIKRHHRYTPNGELYLISVALKNDASPLLAMMAALRSAYEKQPEHFDLYMRVLFLEGEAAELALTTKKVVAAEKKRAETEAKLAAAVHMLRKVLDGMTVAFVQNGEGISTAKIGELRSTPIRPSLLSYQEGDTAEDEEWRATMRRDPGEDDDL